MGHKPSRFTPSEELPDSDSAPPDYPTKPTKSARRIGYAPVEFLYESKPLYYVLGKHPKANKKKHHVRFHFSDNQPIYYIMTKLD